MCPTSKYIQVAKQIVRVSKIISEPEIYSGTFFVYILKVTSKSEAEIHLRIECLPQRLVNQQVESVSFPTNLAFKLAQHKGMGVEKDQASNHIILISMVHANISSKINLQFFKMITFFSTFTSSNFSAISFNFPRTENISERLHSFD